EVILMLSFIVGIVLIVSVLWEAFETIILPRRVRRRFRLTRVYYRATWLPLSRVVRKFRGIRRQESLLSFYGPLSLIVLLGMWAGVLILGFGLLHYGIGSQLRSGNETRSFAMDAYLSGTTFFTLGLGDVTPVTWTARLLTVFEAGLGFGFLAIVVGYLPVIY